MAMELLLPLLFFVSALFLFLKLYGNKAKKTCSLPPSPPKLPIIGHFHQLGDLPHQSFRSLAEKHGPLILLQLGQVPTLVVSSAEMAEEFLKTHDVVFASKPSLTAPRRIMYGCTDMGFSPYGEYWRQVRKLCVLELLSVKRVSSFRYVREEEVGLMVKRVSQACSKGEAVNLTDLLLAATTATLTRVAYGKKYGGEAENGRNRFAGLGEEATTLLGSFFVGDYFPSLAWVDVLTGMDARLKKNSREIDGFLDQVIEDHVKRREGKRCWEGVEEKDLVDVLLDVQKSSMIAINISRDNLKAILLDMFAGGTDTTAVTAAWTMAEIMKHPEVMEKVQAEIRRVVGKNENVKEEDLDQLHYLKLVIKETLRLHPVAPLLTREATKDVVVRGYHISAKTRVFINAYAIGRDSQSWENAEEFIPERFANVPTDFKGQDFQFIPFGAGRRGCPGIAFGLNSLELALANLLYRFDWKLPEGQSKEDINMSETFGLVIRMKYPLRLIPKNHFS